MTCQTKIKKDGIHKCRCSREKTLIKILLTRVIKNFYHLEILVRIGKYTEGLLEAKTNSPKPYIKNP